MVKIKRVRPDLISRLPEDVIHEIMRRLSVKQAAKTCVLSKLVLVGVMMQDKTFTATTSSMIKSVKFDHCYNLTHLELLRLPHLKNVEVISVEALESIKIQAPNLQHVNLYFLEKTSKIEIEASSLEQVVVVGSEHLKIEIRALNLKNLRLDRCHDIRSVEVEASTIERLVLVRYYGDILDHRVFNCLSVEDISLSYCAFNTLKLERFSHLKRISVRDCSSYLRKPCIQLPNREHIELDSCSDVEIEISENIKNLRR
ncbi:hypothetical protein ACFE04_019315 [Oxalis oulophora]